MSLAEFFPPGASEAFAKRNLKPGSVLLLYNTAVIPPKTKLHVVLAVNPDRVILSAILINTEINLNVNYSQELRELHLPCSCDTREYLDHDSYFDCSSLFQLDYAKIVSVISGDPKRLLGEVSEEDLVLIKQTVRDSGRVKGKMLKRLGFYDAPILSDSDQE